jgi:hypothetical protein
VKITGDYLLGESPRPFQGSLKILQKLEHLGYSWSVVAENQLVAGKTGVVEFSEVPSGQKEYEYVRDLALEEIRQYTIQGQKAFANVTVRSVE